MYPDPRSALRGGRLGEPTRLSLPYRPSSSLFGVSGCTSSLSQLRNLGGGFLVANNGEGVWSLYHPRIRAGTGEDGVDSVGSRSSLICSRDVALSGTSILGSMIAGSGVISLLRLDALSA